MSRHYMSRRTDDDRRVPALNTSSLPDLIFTVLFFFMIVTHMRDVELKVRYEVPQGTEVLKLTHKSAVTYIYVGNVGDSISIQLNDKLATVDDIARHIDDERSRMSAEDQARMTVSLKADRDVPMSVISDIKRALQRSYALRINYSATESASDVKTMSQE